LQYGKLSLSLQALWNMIKSINCYDKINILVTGINGLLYM